MWFNYELYYFIFDLFLACMDHLLNAVSLLDPCKCDLVAQWRLISLLLYTRYYFTFVASFCVKVKCVLAALTHRQCTDSNFVMEERVKSSLLLYTILLLEIVGEWVMIRRPFWIKIMHISPILLGRFSDKKSWKLLSVLCK